MWFMKSQYDMLMSKQDKKDNEFLRQFWTWLLLNKINITFKFIYNFLYIIYNVY